MSRVSSCMILMLSGMLAWATLAGAGPKPEKQDTSSVAKEGATFYSLNAIDTLVQEYESPDRAAWQKPQKVVEHLLIKPGSVVADIGSGTGYFSVLLAKAAGANGTVYAVDNDGEMIAYLENRVKKEGQANIRTVLAKPDDSLLPKGAVDLIFICNTYMFIEKREQYLTRLKDSLKNDGRLAVVSFNRVETPEGPPLHTRVSRDKTVQEAQKAGFALEAEYFFLPYQHFLLFVKR